MKLIRYRVGGRWRQKHEDKRLPYLKMKVGKGTLFLCIYLVLKLWHVASIPLSSVKSLASNEIMLQFLANILCTWPPTVVIGTILVYCHLDFHFFYLFALFPQELLRSTRIFIFSLFLWSQFTVLKHYLVLAIFQHFIVLDCLTAGYWLWLFTWVSLRHER